MDLASQRLAKCAVCGRIYHESKKHACTSPPKNPKRQDAGHLGASNRGNDDLYVVMRPIHEGVRLERGSIIHSLSGDDRGEPGGVIR